MMSRIFMIVLMAVNVSLVYGVKEEECNTTTIRYYKELKALTNCTVILGNLAIVFPPPTEPPDYQPEDVNNWTFPLREVTGYVVIVSVPYLDSLGKMFPNLTVIRGQRFFSNYALAIYSTDLAELGLWNLLKISRGAVRIGGENERLCLPQIDWNRIVMNQNIIVTKNATSADCNRMNFTLCSSCPEPNLCWHGKMCQRFESSFQKSKYRSRSCHPLCLGDCVNETASGCYTCKDISENSECVESCSETKVLNVDTRRCIDYSECMRLNRTIFQDTKVCLQNCPPGYSTTITVGEDDEEVKNSYCRKCNVKCPKFCVLPEIRFVSQLEDIGSGCTIVRGDLEINIVDDIFNLTAELQTYLGNVEEIWGCLKIHRSPSITELTFLNRLRHVEGRKNKTAILIFENQNLQTIFDWRSRAGLKLKVKMGSIQIYRNILLCGNETKRLQKLVDRTGDFEDLIQSNGAKNKCTDNTIEASSSVLSHDSCAIRWKDVNPTDKLKFNAYIIQYVAIKTAKSLDDEMFLERDSCSSYGWQNAFVKQEDWRHTSDGSLLEYNLTNLHQFTTYAFSIQTYQYGMNELMLNNTESDGAISHVQSFRTFLKAPSRVQSLGTYNKSADSIMLTWSVVENEEMAINFFYLDVVQKPFKQELLDRRNYCNHPIEDRTESDTIDTIRLNQFVEEILEEQPELPCCDKCCMLDNQKKKVRQQENNDFQAGLVTFSEKVPRRDMEPTVKIKEQSNYLTRIAIDPYQRNYTIFDLNPFTIYNFYLHACSSATRCSEYEFHSEMTIKSSNESFDRVELRPASYVFETQSFHVRFDEPREKNGAIVSYITELREIVKNTSLPLFSDCIPRRQHQRNGFKYSIKQLLAGNYAFRVLAVSLAGRGSFTDFHEFRIIHPDNSISKGWIMLGVVIALLLACIAAVSYYYKHKIMTLLKGHNDRIILLQDIEPTDFNEMSLHHKSFDNLSDIMENDE